MPRTLVLLLLVLALVGLLYVLSTQAQEVPVRTIETEVARDGDAR